MTKLEPCPFCGKDAEMQKRYSKRIQRMEYRVVCSDVWCVGHYCGKWTLGSNAAKRQWNPRYKRTCKPTIKERYIMAGGEEYSFWQAICDCGWIVGEDGTPNLSEFEHIDNYCSKCGAEIINEP